MSHGLKRDSFTTASIETLTDEENANTYGKIIQVRCGTIIAKMHVELFLCPGIHQPCIELGGEMISPKEFTVRANKDKQKDWKGSIRIGKSNLRSLMEMHSFDFFNHTKFCSAKCQSRNYITPKEKECDKERRSSLQAERAAAQITQLFNSHILNSNNCGLDSGSISHLIQLGRTLSNNNGSSSNKNYIQLNNDDNTSALTSITNPQDWTEELVDVDDSLANARITVVPTTEQILLLMLTEPVTFWNEMHKSGLLDELVDLLTQCLSEIKKAAKSGGLSWAAPVLTRVVSVLNMSDRIAKCVHAKPKENVSTEALPTTRTTVENCTQPWEMDETLRMILPQCSPFTKRPRIQYTSGIVPYLEGLDVQTGFANNTNSTTLEGQEILVPPKISCLRSREPLVNQKFT
ncbi:unnamed protein product [Cylicocyclus nassatus]|uniref:SAND domain-containing protein n=1 Tax=Cylicocyclus nassatus TaxID=53992 RepID=A0AA36HDA6_CYLNA|nr:unnamed protein product [Cylicocyclus nassatus]